MSDAYGGENVTTIDLVFEGTAHPMTRHEIPGTDGAADVPPPPRTEG